MKLRNFGLFAAAAALVIGASGAWAQSPSGLKADTDPTKTQDYVPPADLTKLPPVPRTFQPKKTSWGDPDLRGTWPIDSLGGLPFQRTPAQGNRVFMTKEEYAAREKQLERIRNAAEAEDKAGKLGMGHWVEETGAGARTSLLVAPANGRLPEMTEYGKRMQAMGRSSWVRNQTYEWVTDFDSWDRCVTRGFPASMLPFRYNNGIQILQSPGYVVVSLEMIHDARVIPVDGRPGLPKEVVNWMGVSRGHWEGNTLVVETDNIKIGASPLNMATIGVPPNNTIPMSPKAHVTERFTLTGPNTLVYEMTYSDPVVWTQPFSVRMDIPRNENYGMFEYACHEGDEQVRNYIIASRSQRAKDYAKQAEAASAQQQAQAAPPPAPAAAPAPKKR
jgi:hypothetical protein